jgi:hypothetical protein
MNRIITNKMDTYGIVKLEGAEKVTSIGYYDVNFLISALKTLRRLGCTRVTLAHTPANNPMLNVAVIIPNDMHCGEHIAMTIAPRSEP